MATTAKTLAAPKTASAKRQKLTSDILVNGTLLFLVNHLDDPIDRPARLFVPDARSSSTPGGGKCCRTLSGCRRAPSSRRGSTPRRS